MFDVIGNKYRSCINFLDEKSSHNYITNVYGLSRSLFAIVTLSSLLFNNIQSLFSPFTYKKKEVLDSFSNINLFHIFGYEGLFISKIIAIVILIICVIGYLPRIFGILQWWVSFSFFNACTIVEGGDQITNNILLLLIPITLMDNRKFHWERGNKENNLYKNFICFVVFTIINIQICILYLQAGIEKLYKVDEWIDGTAIYYWLNSNLFGLTDFFKTILFPIINNQYLLFIINWGVIIFELIMAGAIFMNYKNKKKLIFFAISFHFLIAVFFGLISFFFAMVGVAILYLLPKNNSIQIKR